MNERDILIPTRFGEMPAFAVCPDEQGDFPAIIVYMDGGGMREVLRNLAWRIAKQGYFVLLPDLYYRLGTIRFETSRRRDPVFFSEGSETEPARDDFVGVMTHCEDHLTNELVMEDTSGMLNVLDGDDKARPGPIGCLGFCFSGRFLVTAVAQYANRVAAAASLYGVGTVTTRENSPHKMLDRVKAEMYFGFAAGDKNIPEQVVEELRAALAGAGVRYEMETFPAGHGFSFSDRIVYDPVAADTAWEKILDLFDRTLK